VTPADLQPRPRLSPSPAVAVALALAILAGAAITALALGPAAIGPGTLAQMTLRRLGWLRLEPTWPASYEVIFFQVRLPRVVLGVLIGGALGVRAPPCRGSSATPWPTPTSWAFRAARPWGPSWPSPLPRPCPG